MSLGVIASILGSLATIFGGIRWLLGVYFKKQSQLEALRKHIFVLETAKLREEVDRFRNTLLDHKADLDKFSIKIEESIKLFTEGKIAQDRVYAAFREFVAFSKERFARLEKENGLEKIQTGEVIGTVTPPEPAPTPNLGKVKVKP